MNKQRMKPIAFVLAFVLVLLCFTPTGAIFAANTSEADISTFRDISGHWGERDIENAVKSGFVKGYEDGTFKPDKAVTRAEFVAMVNKALQLRDGNTAKLLFQDVKETAWYYQDIQKASYVKYVSGITNTNFMPNKNITREEAAAMLERFLPKEGNKTEAALGAYADKSQISSWAKDAMAVVIDKGYLTGYTNGNLAPKAALTRAEAAKIIGKILDKETIVREDVSVKNTGEILKDKIYIGDITIEKSVGEGEASLENLSALSGVYVEGGGTNSVTISNSTVIKLIVCKEGTKVRVLSEDGSTIYNAFVFNDNLLVDDQGQSAETGENGFENIIRLNGTVTADMAIRIANAIAGLTDNTGVITQEQVAQGVADILTGSVTAVNPDGSITVIVQDSTMGTKSKHHKSNPDNSPKQLTIGNPLLELSKVYDGTTTAAVTAGALSGVLSGDTVTVSAIAFYDTASVGFDKTITVVYTIGGADANKYLKPINFTTNAGMILNAGDYAVTISESNDLSGAVIDVYDEFYFGTLLGSVTTNSSGQAKIALPNGYYHYKANKTGFGIVQGMFCVSGAAVTEDFTMAADMPVKFEEHFTGVATGSMPAGWSLIDTDDWFVDAYSDAGGEAPELCYVTYYETGTFSAITCPIDLTAAGDTLNLSLKHYLSLISPAPTADPGFTIKIKITKNNGATWQTLFSDDPTLAEYPEDWACGPFTENFDISSYAGETVKLAFTVEGDTNYLQYWSIDDVVISGE